MVEPLVRAAERIEGRHPRRLQLEAAAQRVLGLRAAPHVDEGLAVHRQEPGLVRPRTFVQPRHRLIEDGGFARGPEIDDQRIRVEAVDHSRQLRHGARPVADLGADDAQIARPERGRRVDQTRRLEVRQRVRERRLPAVRETERVVRLGQQRVGLEQRPTARAGNVPLRAVDRVVDLGQHAASGAWANVMV